jgi:hypothetical protein
VGVGTNNPQTRLEVDGSLKATGTLKAQSANIMSHLSINEGVPKLSIGSACFQSLNYGTAYIGFNAERNNGTWAVTGDGSHNGGSVIWNTIFGDLYFATISGDGASNKTLTDMEVKDNIKLHLTPAGALRAKKMQVSSSDWPDYVFAKDYNLRPLDELEQYIKENHHLPEIPSAKEVEENGIDLGDMQSKLLLKIEELTLYILSLQKQIDELKQTKGGE